MPFKTLQNKDFIGRQQELTALFTRVQRADAGAGQSIVLSGERGFGKTEFLKQLFGTLFWKQDRVSPFYYKVNPALLSAQTFSKDYLAAFLCQRLAFEKKEQALFAHEVMSLPALSALAEDRGALWAKEILDQYQQNAGDPLTLLRIALGAPRQSMFASETPVAVLIDEFHRLQGLSIDGIADPKLVALLDGLLSSPKVPHVLTGNSAELQEMSVLNSLERIELAPLESTHAALFCSTLLQAQEAEGTVSPLLLRRLNGNPFYLGCVCRAVSELKKPEEKDFWNAYTREIMQGTLARYWSSILKNAFPELSMRSIALALCHKIYHMQEPLNCSRIASSFALSENQTEVIAHALLRAGIIRGEFGVFRSREDAVLRDVIAYLYQHEVLAKPVGELERDYAEKLLPEKANVMRYELVLPMTKEAELVAAQCLDQVGKNLKLDQDAIGQLQIAVIEACINAMEHSRGTERKIYVGFVADERQLEVSIESAGREFIVQETGEVFGDSETTRPAGRGWGIKLMKRYADDVRFEKTSRGTKTVLIKNLDKSLRTQEEAKNNE
jgi:anti-sigma regulatory factor (Ser/Thr protein kinase)